MPLDILLKTLNKLANKYSFSSLRAFGAGSTDMSVDEALNLLEFPSEDLGDEDKLKAAFRKAAMKHHPDRGGSEDTMKKINKAYDILKESKQRKKSDTDWEEINTKYRKAASIVIEDLKKTFKPDAFSSYLEEQTGKKYTNKTKYFPEDVNKVRSPSYASVSSTWRSEDNETVFTLHASVTLHDVVWPKAQLGGEGLDIGYDMYFDISILHDNRDVKFKRQKWGRSQLKAILYDPKHIFPEAKIKKMLGGKDKARKFSKRDMELGLVKKLNASLRKEHTFIPMGVDISTVSEDTNYTGFKAPFTLVLNRTVFSGGWNERRTSVERKAYWSFESVYENKKSVNRINFIRTYGVPYSSLIFEETEDLLKLLTKMQNDSKNLKEIKDITDLIIKEIKEVKGDTKVESNLSNKVELKKQLKEMGIKVVAGNYVRKKDIKKVIANKTASEKQRNDAMLLGYAAHEEGLSCIPAHDKKLMEIIKKLTGLGTSKPLLDSWIKGWHRAAENDTKNYKQKAA